MFSFNTYILKLKRNEEKEYYRSTLSPRLVNDQLIETVLLYRHDGKH